jgi:glycerol-3-phosphate dehydrogenase
MPHDSSLRPAWMIRAGLFLYDHLARRRHLAGSRGIDLRRHPAGAARRRHPHAHPLRGARAGRHGRLDGDAARDRSREHDRP